MDGGHIWPGDAVVWVDWCRPGRHDARKARLGPLAVLDDLADQLLLIAPAQIPHVLHPWAVKEEAAILVRFALADDHGWSHPPAARREGEVILCVLAGVGVGQRQDLADA